MVIMAYQVRVKHSFNFGFYYYHYYLSISGVNSQGPEEGGRGGGEQTINLQPYSHEM